MAALRELRKRLKSVRATGQLAGAMRTVAAAKFSRANAARTAGEPYAALCRELVALAGASADCETMWQIGVDVLPAYRRKGLAEAVTSRLAQTVLERGKVPFYCVAWSNLPSVRNAIACGFVPAWVQLTAKPIAENRTGSSGQ